MSSGLFTARGRPLPGGHASAVFRPKIANFRTKPALYNGHMHLPATTSIESRFRVDHLSNGLKVVVKEVHTSPLVSVWCWYRVGSGDEAPGLTGVSHWVEHMNFKGTVNIPREQMKGIVERFGGMWNGYTWIDQTTYLETAGRAALDQMLFIEAERMAYGLYEAAECESERTVIISELQGGENDPDQLLETEVTATAFRAHPYGHPTIGWIEDLRSMTRDDLYGFYRRFYIPNNATLVVVGDVDAGDVMRRAEKHFASIPEGTVPQRIHAIEPEQVGERRLVIEREGTIGYVKMVFRAPAASDPDFFPMLVLDAVLSGAKGVNLWSSFRGVPPQRKARLYTALVERGLASTVSGAILPTAQPYLYTLSFTANDGVPLAAVEEAALVEIERVQKLGVEPSEVERARHQLRARLVFDNDGVTNIAHQLGYFETVAGPGFLSSIQQRIEGVTPGQIWDVARRRLSPTNRTVGWFRPAGRL
jgi:zinc protease